MSGSSQATLTEERDKVLAQYNVVFIRDFFRFVPENANVVERSHLMTSSMVSTL
jgi:hypothetical protein